MSEIDTTIDKAISLSQTTGTRLTTTRKQVLTALLKAGKALSAYELADQVKAEFNRAIPAMSVYRILDVFVESKFVHKVNLVNKYVACSHITCDHKHAFARLLVCNKCHKVEELMTKGSTLRTLQGSVEKSGFQLLNSQLELNCICHECAS